MSKEKVKKQMRWNYNCVKSNWHEFGYSVINPLTSLNPEEIETFAKLFEPIAEVMKKQAYGKWESCLNEHKNY